MNEVQLEGCLGKDAETRNMSTGDQVVSFSLATNEGYKKDDKWIDRTEWHNIVVFGNLTKVASELKKGDKVVLKGSLKTRKYTANNVDKYTTEVVIQGFNAKLWTLTNTKASTVGNREVEVDDDLPF